MEFEPEFTPDQPMYWRKIIANCVEKSNSVENYIGLSPEDYLEIQMAEAFNLGVKYGKKENNVLR